MSKRAPPHIPDGEKSKASNASKASEAFRRFANLCANKLGSAWAFIAAVGLVVAWALTGPVFHFSETWQLVINTGTTIITFLMVFLIQSSQNRDAKAVHLKLDELVRSSQARNAFADIESATEKELDSLQREFEELRKRSRRDGEDEKGDSPL